MCLTFWPPPSWTHPPAGRTSLRVPASASDRCTAGRYAASETHNTPLFQSDIQRVATSSVSDRCTEDCYVASETDNTPLNTKYSFASDRCTEDPYVASETHNTSLNTHNTPPAKRSSLPGTFWQPRIMKTCLSHHKKWSWETTRSVL